MSYSAKRAVVSNLEKYMKLKGVSAAELHRKTGITKANISQYCSGKTVPGLDALEKIAEALSISVSALVSEARLSDPANKILSSPEFKEVTMTARHEHRAKSDFEWQGKVYKKGDLYNGPDVPILLYMKLIEVTKSSYSVEADRSPSDIEVARLRTKIKLIPEEFFDLWPGLRQGRRAVCLYVLTGDRRFVPFLSDDLVRQLESLLQLLDRDTPQTPE